MFDKIKKRYAKRITITLSELYRLAEESGVDVKSQPYYTVNSSGHHIMDNDTLVLHENWFFKIVEPFDINNPQKELKYFEYYVGMNCCRHCEEMENFRKFNDKYKLCSSCFKTLKKKWDKKESKFEDYIDSQIVLRRLINK